MHTLSLCETNPLHPFPTSRQLAVDRHQEAHEAAALALNEKVATILRTAAKDVAKLVDGSSVPSMAEGYDWTDVLALLRDVTPVPCVTESIEEWAYLSARGLL